MTLRQAEVIVSLADNNLNARAAARAMYVHYQTLLYNIRQIQKNTGLNPTSYHDMNELLPMAREVLAAGGDNT